jgi:predicted TIM-barrel fold metal-dependent hydrolase
VCRTAFGSFAHDRGRNLLLLRVQDTGTRVGHRGLFSPKSLRVLAQVAKRYPTLHLIVNHVAGVPVNGKAPEPEWLSAMQKLAEHPNVYIKFSGHMEASTIHPAPTELGWYLPLFRVWA